MKRGGRGGGNSDESLTALLAGMLISIPVTFSQPATYFDITPQDPMKPLPAASFAGSTPQPPPAGSTPQPPPAGSILPLGSFFSPPGQLFSPPGPLLSALGPLLSPPGPLLSPPGSLLSSPGSLLSPPGSVPPGSFPAPPPLRYPPLGYPSIYEGQTRPGVMRRSMLDGVKSGKEAGLKDGYFGPAAGCFADVCGYFNPYTIETIFKPLMAVVGAYRSMLEEGVLRRSFNTDAEWLQLWTSTASKESDYWLKWISRLYTAAAMGDIHHCNTCLLKLCTGGFVTGTETRIATPVNHQGTTWETWLRLMIRRIIELTHRPAAPTAAAADVQTPMQQIAARINNTQVT